MNANLQREAREILEGMDPAALAGAIRDAAPYVHRQRFLRRIRTVLVDELAVPGAEADALVAEFKLLVRRRAVH